MSAASLVGAGDIEYVMTSLEGSGTTQRRYMVTSIYKSEASALSGQNRG